MNAAAFAPSHSQSYQQSSGVPSTHSSMSPLGETPPFSRAPSGADLERMNIASASSTAPAILIRNLARHMTEKELRSMFLFAKDFIDSEFLAPEYFDDHTHVSAIARFKSSSAAFEAKAMLDGKPNTATEANMIVEVLNGSGSNAHGSRRPTSDGMANRGPSSSTSSTGSSAGVPAPRQASRYNGTFQNMERISPPGAGTGLGNGDLPAPETGSHFQSLFSPQSPIGNQATERPRVTGKSVINDDSVDDDETGELLKDPVAYARSGNAAASASSARRMTGGQPPVSRFGGLSLSTSGVVSPPNNAFASPRNALQSPGSALSPAPMPNLGPNAAYQLATQHFQRPNYPPVNPADQNPPCNTLYVGNLPIDTSEDELKAMFSKQRGYKRLCFRTKQNGPMCFVEFEDVSFATKALNELYGHPLHNSVKGGIRLSFSKNPLGVRTGQPGNGVGLSSPSSSHGNMPGMTGIMAGGPPGGSFGTATGPPPGLSAPPGLQSPTAGMPGGSIPNLAGPINGGMISGTYGNSPFGMNGGGLNGGRHAAMTGGISTGGGHGASMHGGGGFGEYMMGR